MTRLVASPVGIHFFGVVDQVDAVGRQTYRDDLNYEYDEYDYDGFIDVCFEPVVELDQTSLDVDFFVLFRGGQLSSTVATLGVDYVLGAVLVAD